MTMTQRQLAYQVAEESGLATTPLTAKLELIPALAPDASRSR